MPLNTYGHSLSPAVGVYEDVYFISPVTDTRVHMSSSSSPHLSPALSLHPDAATAGVAGGGGCGLAGKPTSRCRDPARRGRAAGDGSATAEQQDAAGAELTARAAGRGRGRRGARGLTDVLLLARAVLLLLLGVLLAFPGGGRLLLHGRRDRGLHWIRCRSAGVAPSLRAAATPSP